MTKNSQLACVRLLAEAAEALRPSINDFADQDTLQQIDLWIRLAKVAEQGALSSSDLKKIKLTSSTATQLTGRCELYSRGLFLKNSDRESPLGQLTPEQLTFVRDVADVTARSLRAAIGSEGDAFRECQEGLGWGIDMAERLGDSKLRLEIQSSVDAFLALRVS